MTTYTLRKGAAEKTRADVVVDRRGAHAQGPARRCRAARGWPSAYGRKFAPLLSTLGFTGKRRRGRQGADRRRDHAPRC